LQRRISKVDCPDIPAMGLTIRAILIAVIGLTLAACGSRHAGHYAIIPGGQAVSAEDVMFVQMMIPHHAQALEMARMAEVNASDPEIKDLAVKISVSQEREIQQMTSWLKEWGVPLLSETEIQHGGHEMEGMLTSEQLKELANTTGTEFDLLFTEYMIYHHEGAIKMATPATASLEPRVAWLAASEIIASQSEEILQMRDFLDRNR